MIPLILGQFRAYFENNFFSHNTLWPELGMSWGKQLGCLAGGGGGGGMGGGEDQLETSVCGMAKKWKILAFLELFLKNRREKLSLWGKKS